MAVAKRTDEEVLSTLTSLFREHGYEGTSLARIMDATGLVKASLYHRFPEGKAQMAEAALCGVDHSFAGHVLAPLSENGDITARIFETAKRLREFYDNGGRACLLDTMTLDSANGAVRDHAKRSMAFWIGRFEAVAKEAGLPAGLARQRAEEAVAAIEGSLVVARVAGLRSAFLRALENLVPQLTLRG